MIFKSLLASMSFMAAQSTINSDLNSKFFLYTSLNGGVPLGLYEDRSVIGIRDVAVPAHDCSTKTVVCFEADGVFFAIPYGSTGQTSDGTKVETVDRMDMNFFGVKTHVHVFELIRNSSRYRFLYSYTLWLVAFSITREGTTATYVMGHATGFKPVLHDGTEIKHPEH